MMFRPFKKNHKKDTEWLVVFLEKAGLIFRGGGKLAGKAATEWLAKGYEIPGIQGEAILYLSQLEQDGVGPTFEDQFILEWSDYYRLREIEEHADSIALLQAPRTCTLTPELLSRGALSDQDFTIGIAWDDDHGTPVNITRAGGGVWDGADWSILPQPAWQLAEAVTAFALRGPDERRRDAQELAWGRIRSLAKTAGARFDGFLARTVVLSPETLDLELKADWVGDVQVIEVIPGLAGLQREKWLGIFDRHSRVQDHYVMATEDGGMVRVIPTPAVAKVLAEVKRMPGRRVSGKRAQAFVRNPYAALGPEIASALPPEVFEKARKQAGLVLYTFSCDASREANGKISHVTLEFYPDTVEAPTPPRQIISDKLALKSLSDIMLRAISENDLCFKWKGKELEIDGSTPAKLTQLAQWLSENWAADKPSLTAEEVFDLSRYGDRIAGIGIEKPVIPPYVPLDKSGKSWMPDSLTPIVKWTPPGSAVPIDIAVGEEAYRRLEAETKSAEAANATMVAMPEWPAPLSIENARELLSVLAPAYAPMNESDSVPKQPAAEPTENQEPEPVQKKPTLLLKEDYVELRANALSFDINVRAELPGALRGDVSLKPHQLQGVAWLQHLWQMTPDVRGCVFADDMGLGKTVQLLTFIMWQHESVSNALPTLVVAPVSLLENWSNEIRKFFRPGIRVLTLYGESLKNIRMPKNALDQGLVAQGLTRFLRPDWLGDAQIVLTTYETLRDLEFSLCAVRWGIMVCDEAQKIKTPTALVTKSAKKQNAAFRVACTGTPVENRLTDLWCLFDFVQPGLLGSPTAFSKTYSRPIEAKSEEQRAAVETLRKLIEPQVMRRMKEDVTDLPPKRIDEQCSRLQLSPLQSVLYGRAVEEYRKKCETAKGSRGAMAVLSMLHTLRTICAHPIEAGDVQLPTLDDFSKRSPKMHWIMNTLDIIKRKDEKVIIFTEFRDIQRALQRYIGERFGLTLTVVNGDTSTQAGSDKSRQARIDAFQATPGFNVIILSTTAVGFGVNVQAANHVIHYTRPWNPAKEDQATDRAYRIGQTKEVTVYCPTVVSDGFTSFEEKLGLLLSAKRELARDMLNGSDDIQPGDWNDL